MMEKKKIRSIIKERRSQADIRYLEDASRLIADKVMGLDLFYEASTVYIYMDCKREVMTGTIIEAAWNMGKKVAVPRVEGSKMVFYYIEDYSQLIPGGFGIMEPEGYEVAKDEDALMIMPGVAFDDQRHRIGYGGGYYDRYLQNHPKHPTVAVAFQFQIMEELPAEETDIKPQMIITEKSIYS